MRERARESEREARACLEIVQQYSSVAAVCAKEEGEAILCVLIPTIYIAASYNYMYPHATICVSSYYYICVLISTCSGGAVV